MKYLVLSLFMFSSLAFGQAFKPHLIQTNDFDLWVGSTFRTHVPENASSCKFESMINNELQAVELKMGVVGSTFDYFGWGMNVPLADLPLKAGYRREFRVVGSSSMVLSYDGRVLKYEWMKSLGLWSRIYPFTLEIDGYLNVPKLLKAQFSGYETDILGRPKKHLTQKCTFHESVQY